MGQPTAVFVFAVLLCGAGAFRFAAPSEKGSVASATRLKTENDTKLPWWANASTKLANFTATEKSKLREKIPWWASASDIHLPNFTAMKDAGSNKDKKLPWWANATGGNLPNFTEHERSFLKKQPKLASDSKPLFATLGPFDSKEAACDYCFTSHTRTSVVPNCQCFAYDGSSGPSMFCTGTQSGIEYAGSKDGGCQCIQNDPTNMGKTSCNPL